jgi:hypothetical protein
MILEPENMVRLPHDPIMVDLQQMGVEGVELLLAAGDKDVTLKLLRQNFKIDNLTDEAPPKPFTKLRPDDNGPAAMAITIEKDQIVLNFGTPMTWLSLRKQKPRI